jgi:AraC-like DNA-binding protein
MNKQDVITDVLETVRFKSSVYFKHGFRGDWGFETPTSDYSQFHIVASGVCTLYYKENKYTLSKGDFIIFPRGYEHQIKANEAADCKPGFFVLKEITKGYDPFENYGDISTSLVCGHYELDKSVSHFMLFSLPELLIIRSDDYKKNSVTNNIMQLLIDELSNEYNKNQIIIRRLSEILFISVLRLYFSGQESSKVSIFSDQNIYQSLIYIHENLNSKLSIEVLTKHLGISRTAFINRFNNVVGATPLQYIKEWRLTKAKQLLKYSELSLADIGEHVGYDSPISFNNAFKNSFKITPHKYRTIEKAPAQ